MPLVPDKPTPVDTNQMKEAQKIELMKIERYTVPIEPPINESSALQQEDKMFQLVNEEDNQIVVK